MRRQQPRRRTQRPPPPDLRRQRQRPPLPQMPPRHDPPRPRRITPETETPMEDESFERIPPQDPHAEQCVLGGMLLSKRAIGEVLEVTTAEDFYRPQHETVFRAVADMYGRNQPADQITVGNYLSELGVLTKIGGPAYLSELVQAVPTAANAEYYAEIVRDCAIRRRIVEAGRRITDIGYRGEGPAWQANDAAQAELAGVMKAGEETDSALLGDDLPDVVAELEKLQSEGRAIGVPTGFMDL